MTQKQKRASYEKLKTHRVSVDQEFQRKALTHREHGWHTLAVIHWEFATVRLMVTYGRHADSDEYEGRATSFGFSSIEPCFEYESPDSQVCLDLWRLIHSFLADARNDDRSVSDDERKLIVSAINSYNPQIDPDERAAKQLRAITKIREIVKGWEATQGGQASAS